jgi:diguanylate cyclase (GGDEF)-like protein
LKGTFRQADIIGRLGGDEFGVLLSDKTGTEDESSAVRRLEENLREANSQGDRRYEMGLSLGIVRHDRAKGTAIEDLLAGADRAMYEEKKRKKARSGPPSNLDAEDPSG